MKGSSRTRALGVAVALCVICVVMPAASASAGEAQAVHLSVEETAFWDGPYIEGDLLTGSGSPLIIHGCYADPPEAQTCFEYPLMLEGGGARLRVALDHPDGRDKFTLELVDPTGALRATDYGGGANVGEFGMSLELFVAAPQEGAWTVRVSADDVERSNFRVRAKLEGSSAAVDPSTLLLPDIRSLPPYEFTFSMPSSQFTGPPVPLSDKAGASCSPAEVATETSVRCLRFSIGPSNVGAGPLDLSYVAAEAMARSGRVTQRVYRADGTYVEHDGGSFEYHATHAHYHHTATGTLTLFVVRDPDAGELEQVGPSPKQGFCVEPFKIVPWETFAPTIVSGDFTSTCGFPQAPGGTRMALEPGWSDVYNWELDGNHVGFDGLADGRYVLQNVADAENVIVESDDTNNASYAYLKISGDDVAVLERGYGDHPWDPEKEIASDLLPRTVPADPSTCHSDSTCEFTFTGNPVRIVAAGQGAWTRIPSIGISSGWPTLPWCRVGPASVPCYASASSSIDARVSLADGTVVASCQGESPILRPGPQGPAQCVTDSAVELETGTTLRCSITEAHTVNRKWVACSSGQ